MKTVYLLSVSCSRSWNSNTADYGSEVYESLPTLQVLAKSELIAPMLRAIEYQGNEYYDNRKGMEPPLIALLRRGTSMCITYYLTLDNRLDNTRWSCWTLTLKEQPILSVENNGTSSLRSCF